MTSRISVIATGGTVAMTQGDSGLQLTSGGERLVAEIAGRLSGVAVRVVDAMAKPSANIGFSDLETLASRIDAEVRSGATGVVVLQGTDTIEETAFALELMCERGAPVCVTGAMRGASEPGSDGPANLLSAIRLAAGAPPTAGVFVVMNDEVHAARYVSKIHTTALNAFSSGEHGLLGRMHEGVPVLAIDTLPQIGPVPWRKGTGWPRVALLPVSVGADAGMVEHVMDGGYDACVVEAFGAGHVPEWLAPLLGDLCRRMPVALASRTRGGRICQSTYGYPGSESDLLGRGLVTAGALSAFKARILLLICLRAGRPELFQRITRLV